MGYQRVSLRVGLPVLLIAFVLPVLASQEGKPAPGPRVAVVAIHDSRLLTVCPVIGKDVVVSDHWLSGMEAKVTVGRASEGMQHIGLHWTKQASSDIIVPIPAPKLPGAPTSSTSPVVRGLERLAPDMPVQRLVEQQFRRHNQYAIVDSPADADVVFLVESQYVSLAAGAIKLPPDTRPTVPRDTPERIFSDTENEWARRQWDYDKQPKPPLPPPPIRPESYFVAGTVGADQSYPNWRHVSLAIAVPATTYRQHAGNGIALTAARVWQGISAAEAPRAPTRGEKPGVVTFKMASPGTLVDQFHDKGARHPDYLPICAASTETIPSLEYGTGPLSERTPDTAAEPTRVVTLSPRANFRAHVTLVTVPVTVVGRDGQNVDDLLASEFHVFEDGIEQKVDRVEPGTAPAQVALLIDTSFSMRPTLERTRDAAQLLLEALRPTDRAMVVSFDRRVRVRAGPTSNRKDLQTALAQVRAAGNTRLYDALALTVLDGFNSMEDRNAIVLFTDGIDTGSQLADAAGALAAIDTSNVNVYVIRCLSSEETPGAASRALSLQESAAGDAAAAGAVGDGPREFLQRLANDTGGRMYVALGDADMRPVFAQISRQLSHQYLLRYYPTNDKLDGTYREIRVTVDRPGQTLRARKGYRAGALLAGR